MLFRIVAVFIFVLVLASAIGMILAQRQRHREASDLKSVARRQTQRRIMGTVFWVSVSGLLFFLTGYFTPVEILVALVFSLLIPCSAILLSTLLTTQRSEAEESAMARDPSGGKTGSAVGKANESQSDEVKGYND